MQTITASDLQPSIMPLQILNQICVGMQMPADITLKKKVTFISAGKCISTEAD